MSESRHEVWRNARPSTLSPSSTDIVGGITNLTFSGSQADTIGKQGQETGSRAANEAASGSDPAAAAAGIDRRGSGTLSQVIVMVDGSGKPVYIEEGEVRNLESQSSSGDLRRKSSRARPDESQGMAIAMVTNRNRNKTPVFRALTASEAMHTSTSCSVSAKLQAAGRGKATEK
jgi:hypothetical protein